MDVTAWNFHTDVGESWSELESSQLGTQVVVEGKYFLEKPFIIRHREGLVITNTFAAVTQSFSLSFSKSTN